MANRFVRSFAVVSSLILCTLSRTGRAQRAVTSSLNVTPAPVRVTIHAQDLPLEQILYTIAQQAGLTLVFTDAFVPLKARMTLQMNDVAVESAFQKALLHTGFIAVRRPGGSVVILPGETTISAGTITGVVRDVNTHRPLAMVHIVVDLETRGVMTGADGSFRISGIAVGTHTVRARTIGYMKQARTLTVTDNATTSVEFALEPSANALDQVVVTGTVVQTELKAVPNAITVITAKDIEQRGITRIDQLFRGDVPGLFAQNRGSGAAVDEVTMFSRGATALSQASAGVNPVTGLTNVIKTYIDGVELADPQYLSQIDPQSIERIEILTGPQASTIYGSNALNGVMQIFTKRGTSTTPQLTLNLLSGFVQNNFSSALTPQHDYSAQLNGIEGHFSYNAGGSWNYIGPWSPAKQTTRISSFGGARLSFPTAFGSVTSDITLRRASTQNRQRGNTQQVYTGYFESGLYTPGALGAAGRFAPTTEVLTGQTLGLVMAYAPTEWWSHEFGLGHDVSDVETRRTGRGYASVSDTALSLTQNHTERHSLRYTTTTRIPVTSLALATVTAGADAWQNVVSSLSLSPQTLTGALTGTPTLTRQPGHNTGGFVQAQLGIQERLFFTYGLRMEWNPDFGEESEPNYAPRYGVAYTHAMNVVTAKLRASYGRSTRPPAPQRKMSQTVTQTGQVYFLPDYGDVNIYVSNPALSPEHQQGGEGGLELYFGTRGSFVVTRYNQTIDALIDAPEVDSIRSLGVNPPIFETLGADGYGYIGQYQYLNIGSIRNQGWELQGSLNTGPITTHGTYSWTKSRTIGVDPRYRAYFTPTNYPQYQPGATFDRLPEHTWAAGVTYIRGGTRVAFNVNGTGRIRGNGSALFYSSLISFIRLPTNRLRMNAFSQVVANSGYALADIMTTHRFTTRIEGVLQVQNLTDRYQNDWDGRYAAIGRQVKVGARLLR